MNGRQCASILVMGAVGLFSFLVLVGCSRDDDAALRAEHAALLQAYYSALASSTSTGTSTVTVTSIATVTAVTTAVTTVN